MQIHIASPSFIDEYHLKYTSAHTVRSTEPIIRRLISDKFYNINNLICLPAIAALHQLLPLHKKAICEFAHSDRYLQKIVNKEPWSSWPNSLLVTSSSISPGQGLGIHQSHTDHFDTQPTKSARSCLRSSSNG